MPPARQEAESGEDELANALREAYPPLRVPSPLRQDLARRLRLDVAGSSKQTGTRLAWGRWLGFTLAACAGVAAAVLTIVVLRDRLALPQPPQAVKPAPVSATARVDVHAGAAIVRTAGAQALLTKGEGAQVQAGDIIEVNQAGQVLVTYFPGQTTEVGPASRLEIVAVATEGGQDTLISLRLLQGLAINRVDLPSAASHFTMSSPAATAWVASTEFRMVTLSAAKSYVAADKGQVHVESGGGSATVRAGEQVVAVAGRSLTVVSQPKGQAIWVVQPGDTLWLIADRHGVSVNDLLEANPWIWDADLILPGWKLAIIETKP